jgi:hypothetical protein
MKLPIIAGGALIALTAFATTADARMMGGSTGMSSSRFSTPSISTSASSSLGNSGHKTWKKPLDSDGGTPDDPTPKTTGKGNGGGTHVTENPYGGYFGPHTPYPHHPHYGPYGNGSGSSSGCGATPC